MAEKPHPILTTELSKDGGGFLYLELVPKASIGKVERAGATRAVKAHLEVPLICKPLVNLPPEPVPCFVHWSLSPKSGWVEGAVANLDGGNGAVTPWLELTSDKARQAGLGILLEKGGVFSVRLTPDHPYADDGTCKLDKLRADLPELSLKLSWHGEPGKKLSEMSQGKGLRVGDEVKLELTRSSWKCPVRFKVSTRLDGGQSSDLDIDFGTSGTSAHWRVGYEHDVLQLPQARGDKAPEIRYSLELQVSEDGASFSTVMTSSIALPLPKLVSLSVAVGEGVQRSLDRGEVDWTADDVLDMFAKHAIKITGRFTGMAPHAALPFVVELWGFVASPPGFMHPLGSFTAPVGMLDDDGAFAAEVDRVTSADDLAAIRGLELFAVMRATADKEPKPLPSSLAFAPLRLFDVEDFAPKPPGLGICSLGTGVSATREPVVQNMWWEIDRGNNLAVYCSVLGTEKTWKDQAKFVLATADNPRALELPARYKVVAGMGRGVLWAQKPFGETKAIAGAAVTVTVESKIKAKTVAGGGTTFFEAKPAIGAFDWFLDTDSKKRRRIHFVVRTSFFPRDGKNLDVVLQTKVAGAWKDEAAGVLSFGPAKNAVDPEGKLDAFVTADANIDRLVVLLRASEVQMKIARPPKLEKLYPIDAYTLAPCERSPKELVVPNALKP